MIKIKRIYDDPESSDGYRVLVDRLWPRGVSKDEAQVDLWLKDIAPSNELRRWFSHDQKKWQGFRQKYLQELDKKPDVFLELKNIYIKHKIITLLYGAKDTKHNQAVVLKEYLVPK